MKKVSLTSEKPRLSFWQIWNMSFGFLGIQFGFALQNANTSRIFETLGGDTKNLAFYWLAAPVTGLLVQPVIGYYSDRTWHPKWGRRRPFFAIGAILASIALLIMPNSPALWIAIGTLWIMDGSINISMEPFRAFVGDMLPPSQRTTGFAIQSFFIGIGAVVASGLPWILKNVFNMTESALGEGQIQSNVKWSFYIGAIAFFAAVMWTVFSTKEYPPDPEDHEKQNKREPLNIRYSPNTYLKIGLILLAVCFGLILWFYTQNLEPQLYVLCGVFGLFGLAYTGAALFMKKDKYHNGFVQIVRDFQNMPKTMVQLGFVQFFSWFALFSMWIYTTSGLTSHTYNMKLEKGDLLQLEQIIAENSGSISDSTLFQRLNEIQADINQYKRRLTGNDLAVVNIGFVKFFLDPENKISLNEELKEKLERVQNEYNEGADWVGMLFGGYNGIAALAALLLPILARATSRRVTHLIALTCGGIGLLSFYFISDPNWLIFSMVGVGIAWASILSVPYAMLSASLPAKKMGYYMGIFNFFIVIPQIVAASVLGFLVSHFFESEFIYALIIGGASMILAGLLCLMVNDRDEVLMKENAA